MTMEELLSHLSRLRQYGIVQRREGKSQENTVVWNTGDIKYETEYIDALVTMIQSGEKRESVLRKNLMTDFKLSEDEAAAALRMFQDTLSR